MNRNELIAHFEDKLANPKLTPQSRQVAEAALRELIRAQRIEQELQDLRPLAAAGWF